jgi:hypothetical protein
VFGPMDRQDGVIDRTGECQQTSATIHGYTYSRDVVTSGNDTCLLVICTRPCLEQRSPLHGPYDLLVRQGRREGQYSVYPSGLRRWYQRRKGTVMRYQEMRLGRGSSKATHKRCFYLGPQSRGKVSQLLQDNFRWRFFLFLTFSPLRLFTTSCLCLCLQTLFLEDDSLELCQNM